MSRERTLIMEEPDSKAVVDFIDRNVCATLTLDGSVLRIKVKVWHGEDSSTWNEHDFEVQGDPTL
jgi:hypothetical protein